MPTNEEQLDVNIPAAATAVVAKFGEREAADGAVEALTRAGFETDQVSVVARGAETVDGVFQPGVLMITVHPEGRDADATRILREQGAAEVTTGSVTATGEVVDLEEAAREEAKP